MKFTELELPGAYAIDLERRSDERGFFARAWCRSEFRDQGLCDEFVQCNISFNERAGTVRGMHYQRPPHAEVKTIRCIAGALYDVIIDLRPESPTYGQWLGIELSAENGRMLYVPEGFAHGYQTLVDGTETFYQVSALYAPQAESGLRWDDPAIGVKWPITTGVAISEKDRAWPEFRPAAATA